MPTATETTYIAMPDLPTDNEANYIAMADLPTKLRAAMDEVRAQRTVYEASVVRKRGGGELTSGVVRVAKRRMWEGRSENLSWDWMDEWK
jgi:hypothetical protein